MTGSALKRWTLHVRPVGYYKLIIKTYINNTEPREGEPDRLGSGLVPPPADYGKRLALAKGGTFVWRHCRSPPEWWKFKGGVLGGELVGVHLPPGSWRITGSAWL